jgi:hypothetical protein
MRVRNVRFVLYLWYSLAVMDQTNYGYRLQSLFTQLTWTTSSDRIFAKILPVKLAYLLHWMYILNSFSIHVVFVVPSFRSILQRIFFNCEYPKQDAP